MSYAVIFKQNIWQELKDIGEFIKKDNPQKALEFVLKLEEKAQSIAENPYLYQAYGRRRKCVHGNYVIIYRIVESKKQVQILHITEGHRLSAYI